MITKYIDFKFFIISLAFGLFLVYITNEKPNIIYVFPTPDNYDKITIKDKADNCYNFNINEVSCPNNKELISQIPPQY
tara:strand:- start:1376 stop:1609 length:234 start_codon:yes stop_codon:yes gene_type:complete